MVSVGRVVVTDRIESERRSIFKLDMRRPNGIVNHVRIHALASGRIIHVVARTTRGLM